MIIFAASMLRISYYRPYFTPNLSLNRDDLPSETSQTLTEHKDEVWYCRFSNDGNRLATGSKDGNITIWNIDLVKNNF